jgi:hypothetical protein
VTGSKQDPPLARKSVKRPAVKTIDSLWTVTFQLARSKESFDVKMPSLADFTVSDDPRVRNFSGVAVYKTTFHLDEVPFTQLGLGWDNDFISEVELNGSKLGVNWYGSRLFDIHDALRDGDNELTIRYTTTLWNSMGRKPLQPAGLIGPVTLR